MRRWTKAIGGAAMIGSALGASAGAAAPTIIELEARLVDTTIGGLPAAQAPLAPGAEPGVNWQSGPDDGDGRQIWHARDLDVGDRMVSLDGSTEIGTLSRAVSFDWDLTALAVGEVRSTARCTYVMRLTSPALGEFEGVCQGTLLAGRLVGTGDGGHQTGTYLLDAGGIPGVGPYLLDLDVLP